MAFIPSDGLDGVSGNHPLNHARILHSGGFVSGVISTYGALADTFENNQAPENDFTYDVWRSAKTQYSGWGYVFSETVVIDSVFIDAHSLGANRCTVTVSARLAGQPSFTPIISTNTVDDSPIFFHFPKVEIDRVNIAINCPAAQSVQIGICRIGRSLQFPQRAEYQGHDPFEYARRIKTKSALSVTGQFLSGVTVMDGLSPRVAWRNLDRSFADGDLASFLRASATRPFALAWRPSEAPNGLGFCWHAGRLPTPRHQGTLDLYSFELEMNAYVKPGSGV